MGYGYQGSGAVRIRSESDSSAALVFIAQCQKALLIMTCVHNVRFPGKPNNQPYLGAATNTPGSSTKYSYKGVPVDFL